MDTRQTDIALAHVNDAYSIATMSRDIIEQGLQWNWTPERVGRCVLSPDINVVTAKNNGEVNLLGVDASWRSAGIGHRLLEWLEKCAIIGGLECCQLELRESNNHARDFYLRQGYTEIEKVSGYYQQKEDAIRMSKCLQEGFFLSAS